MKELKFNIPARLTFRTLYDVTLHMGLDVDDVLEDPVGTLGAAELDEEQATAILTHMVPDDKEQWYELQGAKLISAASFLVAAYMGQLHSEFELVDAKCKRLFKRTGQPRKGKSMTTERIFACDTYTEYARMLDDPIADVLMYMNLRAVNVDWANRNADANRSIQLQLFLTGEEATAAGLNKVSKAGQKASGSLKRVGTQSKASSGAIINFNRVIQDAPFGILGVANNIDPLLISFEQLKQQSGGAKTAMISLAKGLFTGPFAIVTIMSILSSLMIAFGPKLLAAFKGRGSEAVKELKDDLKEIKKELTDTLQKLDDYQAVGRDRTKAERQLQDIFIERKRILGEITKLQESAAFGTGRGYGRGAYRQVTTEPEEVGRSGGGCAHSAVRQQCD